MSIKHNYKQPTNNAVRWLRTCSIQV